MVKKGFYAKIGYETEAHVSRQRELTISHNFTVPNYPVKINAG